MMLLTVAIYMIFLSFLLKVFIKLWRRFNRKIFEWNTNDGKYWAVVTGSTDGIGFEFARQLALKGYNLLMISRNEQKLKDKSKLILDECNNQIKAKTLAVDFKRSDIYDRIRDFLHGHDIFILVNNVGFGADTFQEFFLEEPSFHTDIINVNIMSTIRMTELCLPMMIEKKRGLVINVSSMASLHIIPSITIYSSTKAFVTYFTRSLSIECRPHNVLVFNLMPGPVDTKLLVVKSKNIPTPQQYVQNSLKTINWTDSEGFGYFSHTILSDLFTGIEYLFGWQIIGQFLMRFTKFSLKKKEFNYTDYGNIVEFLKFWKNDDQHKND